MQLNKPPMWWSRNSKTSRIKLNTSTSRWKLKKANYTWDSYPCSTMSRASSKPIVFSINSKKKLLVTKSWRFSTLIYKSIKIYTYELPIHRLSMRKNRLLMRINKLLMRIHKFFKRLFASTILIFLKWSPSMRSSVLSIGSPTMKFTTKKSWFP